MSQEIKHTILIIYDISDNSRRYRMAKLLKGFGYRVQRSAFECLLSTSKYNKLISNINKLVVEEDLVRVYKLHDNIDIKIWGDIDKIEDEDVIFI